ncbi:MULTISPECIES: hypothetical protein [unclassified Limnothrix]|uniref:hypothetical protein n=1 Tax=unclassified Limnothrix TaxID=2632864 RepID=UPI00167FE362|nr:MULTISPECIES: hypothetical protein [unclassified Limnothrix]MBD2190512.1 hypothetical protein [Limnothrix sp. FACHB-1088]
MFEPVGHGELAGCCDRPVKRSTDAYDSTLALGRGDRLARRPELPALPETPTGAIDPQVLLIFGAELVNDPPFAEKVRAIAQEYQQLIQPQAQMTQNNYGSNNKNYQIGSINEVNLS